MFNKEIEKIIEDTCDEECRDKCGDDEECMEKCLEGCSNMIEDEFDVREITFTSEKVEKIEALIDELWKISEELKREGLRRCEPARDIEYFFTKSDYYLNILKESVEDYVNYLIELKKKGEL